MPTATASPLKVFEGLVIEVVYPQRLHVYLCPIHYLLSLRYRSSVLDALGKYELFLEFGLTDESTFIIISITNKREDCSDDDYG